MKMKTVVEILTPISVNLQHETNQLLLLMSKFDYLNELYLINPHLRQHLSDDHYFQSQVQ